MLRALCSICTELFSETSDIAAIFCGHTFHHECLQKWLNQAGVRQTCPQCRMQTRKNQVIPKLYFDKAEPSPDQEEDPSKLKNDYDNLKVQLLQKDREKSELIEEQASLYDELEKLRISKKSLETKYKKETATCQSLRTELIMHEKQRKEAEYAKEDARVVRRKLEELQNVEKLVRGVEHEAQDVISENQGDAKQMATWCLVLKKELALKKQECRKLREEITGTKRDSNSQRKLFENTSNELFALKEQYKLSQEDLNHAEDEIKSLKRKIETLQKAIGSPSATAASLAHRLINESPAPMCMKKRPKISGEENGEISFDLDNTDLNTTPDLFDSPPPKKKIRSSPSADQGYTPPEMLKFTSASDNRKPAKKHTREIGDISNVPALCNFNIFKKHTSGTAQTSMIRNGYNGMGGHGKFIQPLPRGPGTGLKIAAKPAKKKTAVPSMKNLPPLPKLGSFMS